jgi:hypothetical protein
MNVWGRRDPQIARRRRARTGIAGLWAGIFLLAALFGAGAFYFFGSELDGLRERERIGEQAAEIAELRSQIAGQTEARSREEELLRAIGRVERERDQLQDETARLRESLATDERSADIDRLQAEIERVRAQNALLLTRMSGVEAVGVREREARELAEGVASELQSRLDRAFNEEIPALRRQVAARDEQLQKVQPELERLGRVEAELRAARSELGRTVGGGDLAAARAQVGRLQEDLAMANQVVADRDRQLAALQDRMRDRVGSLESRLGAANDEVARLASLLARRQQGISGGSTDEASSEASSASGDGRRDPSLVDAAMRKATGLAGLAPERRNLVADRLIAGDCVGDVLSEVFHRVPAVTLRDLIATLQADC